MTVDDLLEHLTRLHEGGFGDFIVLEEAGLEPLESFCIVFNENSPNVQTRLQNSK